MRFAPIAIVGRGCVLPSALSPAALWELVLRGGSAITATPAHDWRVDPAIDRASMSREIASQAGGHVRGFDRVWDPSGFQVDADQLAGLDPVFTWTLHAAREAVRSAGLDAMARRPRGVVVLGNLSYPVPALSELALDVWERGTSGVDPRNRFMSSLPAQLTAAALGFGAGGFALDAACASSLYAIKLACDRLHDGTADIALAGGVNHADDLFLHLGFTALSALSPTGQSRPFHRRADGLVPAHGAAMVALRRLADAETDGDRILGVIRGIGLANDGRGRGLLVPMEQGQVRSMRAAYASSGLAPADISLVECHATGTAVGDAVELRSMRAVFEAARDLPIGSLKSNLGHLITASGAAALLKVLGAMEAGIRPATLSVDDPLDELAASPFRALTAAEPWPSDGPRRAAISSFGFGGNNSHLIVEQWAPRPRASTHVVAPPRAGIAVVALEVIAGGAAGTEAFAEVLLAGRASGDEIRAIADFDLDVGKLRFPPSDIAEALPQQTLLCCAALALSDTIDRLPRERTSVLVGMQCDAEIARCSLRWRRRGADAGRSTAGPLDAAVVLGCMPNVVANRLSSALDLAGPSFTVSADEASGTVALELAARSLAAGEIDAALVCAVDLCCEPVHRLAAEAVLPADQRVPGDAAVVLVLKRLDDARRDRDPVLAVIEPGGDTSHEAAEASGGDRLTALFGHAHAASGLLQVAAAVTACDRRATLPGRASSPAAPWLPASGERRMRVQVRALGGTQTSVSLRAGPRACAAHAPSAQLAVYAAEDLAGLARALERDDRGTAGAMRAAVISTSAAQHERRIAQALAALGPGATDRAHGAVADGVYLGRGAMAGELAFVFTGPAGAYPRMGRDLLLDVPELVDGLATRMAQLRDAAGWLYDDDPSARVAPADKLWSSSFLAQIHGELTRGLVGIQPQAAIGYCSGETNALFALGAWSDLDGFRRAIDDSGLYQRELSGELACVRRAWSLPDDAAVAWSALRVLAPVEDVRAALADEPRAHLTIQNSPRDTVIAGDAAACARVAARVGPHRVRPLDYEFVMHCPEARPLASVWRALHHRPTAPVPGVRFYTHATLSSYAPTAERAADALTGQAMNPIDFPAIIERAYADGIRIFVEHGPHAGCTRWIDEILGDRPHLAVALDRYGQSSTVQAADAIGCLFAAGVPMDVAALTSRLSRPALAHGDRARHAVRVTAHPPPVRFAAPDLDAATAYEVMAPAPALPPILPVCPAAAAPPVVGPLPGGVATRPALLPLAALHVAFVQQQAAAHAEFLRLVLGASRIASAAAGPSLPGGPGVSAETSPAGPALPARAPQPSAEASARNGRRELPRPRGPSFDRAQLETLASGQISSVFGPRFAVQDGYARQVRMPEPPLLLADRVLGIDGAPGEMGVGTIWTQTDVTEGAWYLHAGRMPAGILVESGQADLLLISWLGVDRLNRGERVYRLLGCDLTRHGELPRPGDTLTYEIHIDGHATQGDVRLFFFHYDCWVNGELRVTVRGGQAGFFTDAELAASEGVLWSAERAQPTPHARLDPPGVACTRRAFTAAELDAFIAGRADACFGPGFERLATHVRTPAIQGGAMRLVDDVTHFDVEGGPWRRGYLRARLALRSDHWFFRGHFKGDPCMPGTLMFEGCLQALATYMAALGFTIERDGWRFEPVAEHSYPLRCRGQALPTSREVVYEVFIDEIIAGPYPTIFADLLGTVDGLRAFHCRRMGLRLVPAWPLDTARLSPSMATLAEGLPPFGDPRALLACAWGRPSEAFGEMYRRFDGPRRVARLPGPPYHFMSRVARVDGPMGGMQVGSSVEAQYDVPRDAWYFADSCAAAMPFCVLLEIALQPCGWLASYVGCALAGEADLVFRNLEGSGAVAGALGPGAGTLTTRAILRSCSSAGGAILVAFDVAVRAAGVEVMTLDTVFGFFGADSMKQQVGLPASDEARAAIDAPGNADIDLTARSGPLFEGTLRIPSGRLLMLDRVSHVAPHGGRAGLGQIRAYKDVAAGDWYFKAHFFQDPVQPGSLGLDAMLQALQILMIERGLGDGIDQPQFEPIASGAPVSWKYRGQVLPENARVTVEVDILRVARDARGHLAEARGSLWVDGKRIYEATLATRIVSGGFDREATRRFWRDATGMAGAWAGEDVLFALLDRFVRRVHVEAPLARRARPGAVFLANHQVTVETVLAALVIGGMTEAVPVLVAKAEHRDSWVGALTQLFAERPGFRDPGLMQFVDRGDPSAVLALRRALADELRAGRSVLVHVEGTRATRGRQPVSVMSSVFLDLALEVDADVVPVRFTGGLPLDGAERREFPVGYGAQDYWFGRPIAAAELRAWRFDERNERVLRAINETGGSIALEVPSPAALAFEARVAALRAAGVPEPQAVVRCALDDLVDPSAEGLTLASDGVLPQEPAAAWLGALARWLRGEL